MTDAEVRAFRDGDERIFRHAVSEHSARLIAYLRGYVAASDTAEDLAQETWLRVYKNRTTFRGDGSFLGWLLAVSRSVALDHLRRGRVEQKSRERAAVAEPPATSAAPAAPVRLEVSERAHRIRVALTELPPRQRDTLVLRLLEDRSVKDTARALGCAEGTVKAALSQALTNLRHILNSNQNRDPK